jgi:hypothetical protein
MANSVDLAIRQVRELQSLVYDNNASRTDLFHKCEEVMRFMNDASREINTNYEDISDKLTKQLNTGRKQ